jgi:hypothetical protein
MLFLATCEARAQAATVSKEALCHCERFVTFAATAGENFKAVPQ